MHARCIPSGVEMTAQQTSPVRISLGPLLYYWPRDKVMAFYDEAASWPVDSVYLGETVCSKRIELRRPDWLQIAKRLTDSAVCLVNDAALDRNLERLLSRQKDSGVSISAPVLEINPKHALIQALAKSGDVSDAAHLLLDQAFILEGEQVVDPAGFAKRLGEVMARAFG